MRHPVALVEVPRIERPAPSAPAITAAAEISAAAVVRERVRNADVLAAIEIARFVVGLQSAALQQACVDAELLHLQRKGDTRDATPDDADRRFYNRVLLDTPSIDEHPLAPLLFVALELLSGRSTGGGGQPRVRGAWRGFFGTPSGPP